jgi:hypothetical protein
MPSFQMSRLGHAFALPMVTTERLGALAAGLPRGLLLYRDELSGWIGDFDRYSSGGSDRAFAIELYGGRSHVIDRVKLPDPIRIPHLSVGVLGGMQPEKLVAIYKTPDDGFTSRILWICRTLCRNSSWRGTPLTIRQRRIPFIG